MLKPATVSDGRIVPNSRLFKQLNGTWIVTWYGRVGLPRGTNSVPPVEVYFHKLSENGLISGRRCIGEAPLTLLNVLRIGSVWDGHVCSQSVEFQEEVFDVSFHEGDWGHTTLADAQKAGEAWASEFASFYPLKYTDDKSWLLAFHLDYGRKLIVPCLEFFTTMYGASSELRRILATYSWPEAEKRMYSSIDDSQFDCWVVSLGPRLVSMDGLFLAWFKYDKYARTQAKSIFSHLQIASTLRWKFLKASPWWKGHAKLKVEGFWLNRGHDFMAFRISGSTFPDKKTLVIMPKRPERGTIDEDDNGSGELLDEKQEIRIVPRKNKHLPLSLDEAPDHLVPTEVHNLKNFEMLNDIRELMVVSSPKDNNVLIPRSRQKIHWKQDDIHSASTGEPYSNGKGVAKAILITEKKMESEGILTDMWNALLAFKDKFKDVLYIGCYDPATGTFKDEALLLVEVAPSEDVKKSADSKLRRWPYMDVKDGILRGFFVAKVVTTRGTAYIIEIQRRTTGNQQTSTSKRLQNEESYMGLVFQMQDESEMHDWIRQFAQAICLVRGKMKDVAPLCPGKAFTFKHSKSTHESWLCEAAVKNALKKVGIHLRCSKK